MRSASSPELFPADVSRNPEDLLLGSGLGPQGRGSFSAKPRPSFCALRPGISPTQDSQPHSFRAYLSPWEFGGTGVSLWDYRPSTKKPNGWHPLRDSRSSPAEDRPRRTLQRSQVRVSRTLTCTLSPWGRSYFRRSGWGTAPQTTLRSKGQGAVFHGPAIRCTLTLASKTGTDQLSDPR